MCKYKDNKLKELNNELTKTFKCSDEVTKSE